MAPRSMAPARSLDSARPHSVARGWGAAAFVGGGAVHATLAPASRKQRGKRMCVSPSGAMREASGAARQTRAGGGIRLFRVVSKACRRACTAGKAGRVRLVESTCCEPAALDASPTVACRSSALHSAISCAGVHRQGHE